MTLENRIKYGLVYVEDILQYLQTIGKFSLTDCAEYRKATCKHLAAKEVYRAKFVENAANNPLMQNLNADALFTRLDDAMPGAIYKSHTTAYLLFGMNK